MTTLKRGDKIRVEGNATIVSTARGEFYFEYDDEPGYEQALTDRAVGTIVTLMQPPLPNVVGTVVRASSGNLYVRHAVDLNPDDIDGLRWHPASYIGVNRSTRELQNDGATVEYTPTPEEDK